MRAGAESVVQLIDQLEELIATGRRVPFSASVVINEDDALDLVDRVRVGLPDDLVQARHTLEDRERIIAGAEQEAEAVAAKADHDAKELVDEAEQRAASLTAESTIIAQAHVRAEAIVSEAESRAASTREEADAYARDLMEQLEGTLSRAVETIRKGIDTLPKASARPRRRKA